MKDDVKLYVPVKYRGKKKQVHSPQEKLLVLRNIRRLTRGWEQEVIDEIIDCVENEREQQGNK